MDIDAMLEKLKETCDAPIFSRGEIKEAMLSILVWLNGPSMSTDENLAKVSTFVVVEMFDSQNEGLPKDIQTILYDMGAGLYDTTRAPDIAKNFESTPEQLLERVKAL